MDIEEKTKIRAPLSLILSLVGLMAIAVFSWATVYNKVQGIERIEEKLGVVNDSVTRQDERIKNLERAILGRRAATAPTDDRSGNGL